MKESISYLPFYFYSLKVFMKKLIITKKLNNYHHQ